MKLKLVVVFLLFFAAAAFCQEKNEGGSLYSSRALKLQNGMTLIFVPMGSSPYTTIFLGFKAGTLLDEKGLRGEAKLLEKLAYKGTEHIGTKDWQLEKKIFDELQQVGDEITEKRQAAGADQKELDQLIKKALELKGDLQSVYLPRELGRLYNIYGAIDERCEAGNDFLESQVSFPKDSLEIFMLLESERIKEPVFRDFYEEREIAASEWEKIPALAGSGYFEGLFNRIYGDGPYGRTFWSGSGNIRNITLSRFKEYAGKALNPRDAVIVVTGDHDYDRLAEMARKYFGTIRPREEGLAPSEGRSLSPGVPEKTAEQAQPDDGSPVVLCYLKPEGVKPQKEALYDFMASYLNMTLMKSDKLFLQSVTCKNGIPGLLYQNLVLLELKMKEKASRQEARKSIEQHLETLSARPADMKAFESAKTRMLMDIYRPLEQRSELSKRIGEWFLYTGDADAFSKYVSSMKNITAGELNQAAKEIFGRENRVGQGY